MINNIDQDEIKIDLIKQDDIEDVLKIEESQNVKISTKKVLEDSLKEKNSIFAIAKSGKKALGYLGSSLSVDHIDLSAIVVDKDYTRRKIASKLLNYLIDFATKKNINQIFLEVRSSNLPAILFYEKLGFKYLSTRKKYYPDNLEDAKIYVLNF